jgi:hypothetical protein
MSTTTTSIYLSLADITSDTVCQSRKAINPETVADYAEVMKTGSDDAFPPIVVFHDGSHYWLADGFHRYEAAEKAGLGSIKVDVRSGDRREAILHSVGANTTHGLRRTNADKRRAVSMLLEDEEWKRWSNSDIARRCGVDEGLVRKLRGPSSDNPQIARKVERNGTVFEMDTSKIGKTNNRAEHRTEDLREEPTSRTDTDPDQQLQELKAAWERASEPVRSQFLDIIFPPETPTQEAADFPRGEEQSVSATDGATRETADPAQNPLMAIWEGLRGHTLTYGRQWVGAGCPAEFSPAEHPLITEKLVPFRVAAKVATPEQRTQFLELSGRLAA